MVYDIRRWLLEVSIVRKIKLISDTQYWNGLILYHFSIYPKDYHTQNRFSYHRLWFWFHMNPNPRWFHHPANNNEKIMMMVYITTISRQSDYEFTIYPGPAQELWTSPSLFPVRSANWSKPSFRFFCSSSGHIEKHGRITITLSSSFVTAAQPLKEAIPKMRGQKPSLTSSPIRSQLSPWRKSLELFS